MSTVATPYALGDNVPGGIVLTAPPRELETLALVAEGEGNAAIAQSIPAGSAAAG